MYDQKSKKILTCCLLLAFFLSVSPPTYADDKELNEDEIIAIGNESISLLECSYLALKAGDQEAQIRFFNMGYKRIIIYFDYVRSGKLTSKIQHNSPLYLILNMNGPSSEFCAGVVWEQIVSNSFDRYDFKDYSGESLKLRAENLLRERNCHILK